MQIPYTYALLAVPPKVLGRQLLPLSLGHCWLLDTLQSPLIKGGKIELSDIVLATIICSHEWRIALDLIQYDKLEAKGIELGNGVSEADLPIAKRELLRYFDYYAKAPERSSSGNDGKMGTVVPWYFCIVVSLLRLNFSEEKAWSCEVGKALCYQTTAAYMDGDKSILSDYEIEQINRDPQDAIREARERQLREYK